VLQEVAYQTERLDHLGRVAGVCREAGRAEWLDAQAGEQRRSVSIGTATVAMILNGLGWSLRQLSLVPRYFENKPVEHVLGEGISADMRERSTVQHLHIDTTSFSLMAQLREELPAEQERHIAVFDSGGYSEANMKSYNEAKIRWIFQCFEGIDLLHIRVDSRWLAH
jgi:Domain of unknown function (DUF4277)